MGKIESELFINQSEENFVRVYNLVKRVGGSMEEAGMRIIASVSAHHDIARQLELQGDHESAKHNDLLFQEFSQRPGYVKFSGKLIEMVNDRNAGGK